MPQEESCQDFKLLHLKFESLKFEEAYLLGGHKLDEY